MKNPDELAVPVQTGASTTALVYTADRGPAGAALILAHGAGAGQHSAWLVDLARRVSAHELDVITFNFLYTEQRRKLPDRQPLLESCYEAAIRTIRQEVASARRGLFIGGKSMGGRIATHVAAADPFLDVNGIVLLGYPLHPPGRPEQRRDAHLPAVRQPMLFVQGSRDGFGTPAELQPVHDGLTPRPTLHVVEGGDHSFRLSGRNPERQEAVFEDVRRTIVGWIASTHRAAH